MYGCMDVWMYGCMDVWIWAYGSMRVNRRLHRHHPQFREGQEKGYIYADTQVGVGFGFALGSQFGFVFRVRVQGSEFGSGCSR